jgi:hypothetical protein
LLLWSPFGFEKEKYFIKPKKKKLKSVAVVRNRPKDRRLSTKLVLTFAGRGCCVVSATNSHGR